MKFTRKLSILTKKKIVEFYKSGLKGEKQIRQETSTWDTPALKEIRGHGLMLGIALNPKKIDTPENLTPALYIVKELMTAGLLTVPAGAETVRWLPPLNVTEQEVTKALQTLKATLT